MEPQPLAGGHNSMGAYERHFIKDKSETKGGHHPVWGFPWVQPENTSSVAQVEALFWSWVPHKGCLVKELQAEAQLEIMLIRRDRQVQFAHLVAK
ncbi:ATP-binding cassette (ABC) Superfamily [Phytophthora palmivora]|uniref:ATP-binding cassette (ABC) Superfamily n=1 Tax=Phytophthora palmivora TaxID=4796 RepID=A0A2P4X2C6_9STRA|nr:ATP-binding cassette (ABC) Superfamily [Phytophthora palmivora]